MGHPALWLSPIGRRRQPDEINQAYIVRLWLELLVRGYLEDHSDDQGWMDVLRLAGWSPGDPELDRRLLDYADGADDDDELNYLELAPGMLPELPPDWIQINSAALYYQHELAYQEVLALQHERVALGVQQAQDALARANPDALLLPLRQAAAQAGTSQPSRKDWQQLQTVSETTNTAMDQLADHSLALSLLVCDTDQAYQGVRLVAEAQQAQRHAAFRQAATAWRDGNGPAELQNLLVACERWIATILAQVRPELKAGEAWASRFDLERQTVINDLQQRLDAIKDQAEILHA
jgi:hypothetical protein